MCNDLIVCLNQLNSNSKLAVATSREFVRSAPKKMNFQFYCFAKPEIISAFPLKFFLHKNFSYAEELNDFIKAASVSGLIEKWRSDIRTQFKEHTQGTGEFGRLTFDNLSGALLIIALLFLFSISIFFLEIVVHKQVRAPNATRFWKITEMIIDPDRHFMLETKWT